MYACANAHRDPFKKVNIYTVTFNYLLLIVQGIAVLFLSSLCGKDGEIMTSQWALPYVHVQNKLDMIINSYIQTKRLLRT